MHRRKTHPLAEAARATCCELLEPRAYLSLTFSSTVGSTTVTGARAPIVSGFYEGNSNPVDLAVATSTAVQILLGDGTGDFTVGGSIPLPTNPASETPFLSSKFIGSDADIVTLSQTSGDGVITYWSSNGDGTFSQLTTSSITDNGAGFTPISGVVGDFAEDGDLAVIGKPGSGSNLVLAIMTNNGDGTFTEAADYPITDSSASGTITDEQVLTSNDNIWINDGSSHHLAVFLGNGDGTFDQQTPISLTASLIAEGQFTDSGNEDIVAVNGDQLTLMEGAGDGTFSAQTPITLAGTITSIHDGDMDRDGNTDIVTNEGVLLGNGDGTFQTPAIALPAAISASGNASDTAVLVDVNGDGKLDVVGIAAAGNAVVTMLNTGLAPTTASLDANDTTNPDLGDGAANQGDDVQFIATVTPVDDSLTFTPTGTVEFFDNGMELGTAPMQSDETATLDAGTGLSQGVLSITADYLGDGNFAPSAAMAFTETVQPPLPSTLTSIVPTANPSALGSDLQFTATVTGSDTDGDTPSGNVEFFDGGTDLGGTDLNDTNTAGVATAVFDAGTALIVGPHSITADYSGDDNFAASDSTPFDETISATAITPVIVPGTSIPTSIISGTVHHGKESVNLTNNGSASEHGLFKVQIFASTDGLVDDTAIPLGSTKVIRTIGVDATVPVPVPVALLSSLPPASYTLLAEATDPLSHVSTSASGPALVVDPATIDLSATVSIMTPKTGQALPGKPYNLAVVVTNNGNSLAVGPLTIDLSDGLNSDGSDALPLPSVPESLHLPAGKQKTFHIRETVAVGTVPDPYYTAVVVDPDDTFNETDLSNNTAVIPTPLTVLDPYPVLLDETYSGPFKVLHGPDKKDTVQIALDFNSESDTTGDLTAAGIETVAGDNFDFSFEGSISPRDVFAGSTSNNVNSDVATYHGHLIGDTLRGTFVNTDGDSGTFDMTLTI